MNPEILVLDEPAAGLDPEGRENIYDIIKRLHHEKNITVIFVSHSMEDIAKLASRIIVMNDSQIYMDDSVSNVFRERDKLVKIGLDIPRVTYFMKKLKEKYKYLNDDIYTIEQAKEELLKYMR